jgi:ribosomal protein L29
MSIAQLGSKIDKVKVYSEGSTVRRLASLSAIAGQINNITDNIEVEIVGLPLALDDASVRVRVEHGETDADDRLIVTDVRVGLSVPAPVEVPISDLETSIQTAKVEVDRLHDLHGIIELEMTALNVLNVPDRPIGEEGKAPPTSPTGARVALLNFKDEQQQLRIKEQRELDLQLRTATENLADLRQQQNLASTANVVKENELRKTIIARLQIGDRQASSLPVFENLQLIVEYFVQGAKWTPTYVCRLNSVTNTAAIALRALICQRTGEDWSGVQIELSTATPTGWCELPELPSLRLGRSQTFASKKAWRNPPQGAEILFEDYDRQKQIADKAISTISVSNNFQIPTLQPLSALTQSILNQKIEDLVTSFDESQMFRSVSPVVNAEFEELESMLQSTASRSLSAPASARMAARSIRLEEMPEMRGRGGMDPSQSSTLFDRVSAVNRVIFDPLQEIKNYGMMRLADPVDTSKRGKLSLPDVKTIYLESLKRFSKGEAIAGANAPLPPTNITVNFDLTEVLQQALSLAVCQHIDPLTDATMRKMAKTKTFDFAYVGTGRVDIPADGQFHSVALLEENAEIDLRYIVVPREDTNVFRIAQLRNPL